MLKNIFAWLARLFRDEAAPAAEQPGVAARGPDFKARKEEDPPDVCDPNILHLVDDGAGRFWLAIFSCPCGCGATIQLPMTPPAHPCWKMRGTMSSPSLWPSVRRTSGCLSHFWIRGGRVHWCHD